MYCKGNASNFVARLLCLVLYSSIVSVSRQVMHQMRRELRQKMEKGIQEFQENLTREEDSAYFRQLEADRLRREFQLATYKTCF